MKSLKYSILLISFLFLFGCSSTDCLKTVTIPDHMTQTATAVTFNAVEDKEVSCDYKEEDQSYYIATFELKNFSYDIVNFKFTPDTGNHTSRLQYEIRLNNNNPFVVTGSAAITINIDGTVSTSYTSLCNSINGNSNCTITFDKEQSLDFGLIKTIKIESVKYILTH